MTRSRGTGFTSTVFTLMLFALFAILSLLQVLYGARVYKGVVAGMDDGYALRASLNYVTNKLHAHDGAGAARIETVDGVDVLCLWDETEETVVCVYFNEGALMEQYITKDTAFVPEAGQLIAELADFECTPTQNGFAFTAWTWTGTMRSVSVSLRSGGDA